MKKTTFFYFGIAIALLFACDSSSTKVMTLDHPEKNNLGAEWLLGEWKYEDENGALHEDWTKKNDTVYSGVSYFIEKKDTLFFEKLELVKNGDSLFFISFGEGNSSRTFKGLCPSENAFKVENPLQSFPRSVGYNYLNDTLMIIEVSGEIDGSEETQPYHMVKKKSK